jgi:hypothetical protein
VSDVSAVLNTQDSNRLTVIAYNVDEESLRSGFISVICPNPLDRMSVIFSSCEGYDANFNLIATCTVALGRPSAIENTVSATDFTAPFSVAEVEVTLQCA